MCGYSRLVPREQHRLHIIRHITTSVSQYLCILLVQILLLAVRRVPVVLFPRIKGIHDNLFSPFYFCPAEGTALQRRKRGENHYLDTLTLSLVAQSITHLSLRIDLPCIETGRTQQVAARLYSNVFVILRTDFAQLESAP